jgi:hypothetical protein
MTHMNHVINKRYSEYRFSLFTALFTVQDCVSSTSQVICGSGYSEQNKPKVNRLKLQWNQVLLVPFLHTCVFEPVMCVPQHNVISASCLLRLCSTMLGSSAEQTNLCNMYVKNYYIKHAIEQLFMLNVDNVSR